MTDYTDLCKRLRNSYLSHGLNYVQEAADALEILRAENAALRDRLAVAEKVRDVFADGLVMSAMQDAARNKE